MICVKSAQAGSYVSYPRTIALSDGTLVCAYDTNMKIACVTSTDGGVTWEKEQTVIAEIQGLNCANAALIQLENGEILCAYRATGLVDGKFYACIKVSISHDNCKTWSFHSTVIETTQDSEAFFGVWEPHFGYIGDSLAVFYSNDSQNDAVNNPEQQNIEFKIWNSVSWGEKHIASDGSVTDSRDGMPVWCQTASGEYVMVAEATTLNSNSKLQRSFIIDMFKSDDGMNWKRGNSVYISPVYGDADYAGAPYVVELPDGRLCVSMQTNEGENGNVCGVITTKRPYNGYCRQTSFTKPFYPFGKTASGNWNSMCVNGEYLLVFSTYSDANGQCIMLRRATF